MKQAWQSVASVARSTIPCSIGPSSIDDDTSLITPYRVRFSSRSPRGCVVADRATSYVRIEHASRDERGIRAIARTRARRIYLCAMTTTPQDSDDVRKIVKDGGIEFLFAQFVDMHGKPSAKLVPATHIGELLSDGAGFAGFAAGDIGQGPDDP